MSPLILSVSRPVIFHGTLRMDDGSFQELGLLQAGLAQKLFQAKTVRDKRSRFTTGRMPFLIPCQWYKITDRNQTTTNTNERKQRDRTGFSMNNASTARVHNIC